MKKIRYFYNTNTLRYEKQVVPLRETLLRILAVGAGEAPAKKAAKKAAEAELGYYREMMAAEPVQLMRCPEDGGECGAGGYCRPEPQQRKPLSDEQVRQIVVDASTSWAFKRDGSTSMRIARAIERAHGIGEPT